MTINSPFDIDEEERFASLNLSPAASSTKFSSDLASADAMSDESLDDYKIDVESPMARFIRGRTEAKELEGQPTELQKKYEDIGLEYDYRKREETGNIWADEEKRQQWMEKQESVQDLNKEIEQENPAFVQRNSGYTKDINLRAQLQEQYNLERGRLDALERSVWGDRIFSESSEGRTLMNAIRQKQSQLDNLREAEDAKLDGSFYESLPDRDMEVANALLSQGVTGKRMSTYTTNHGNIRDNINELALNIPEDKREEFKTKVLGDYIRDEQGNIVRNAIGEELRKGGELVSVTPYGTYDFTISPKVFAERAAMTAQSYIPKSQEDITKTLSKDITAINDELSLRYKDKPDDPRAKKLIEYRDMLLQKRSDLSMQGRGFEAERTEPFVNEPITQSTTTVARTPTVTEAVTETTEISPDEETANQYIQLGIAKRGEDGLLVPTSKKQSDIKLIEDLNKRLMK